MQYKSGQYMKSPMQLHFDAMLHVMKYCMDMPNRSQTLHPEGGWNGPKDHLFEISGKLDSDCTKCPVTQKSVTGFVCCLMG
jgi:hypothetical protein